MIRRDAHHLTRATSRQNGWENRSLVQLLPVGISVPHFSERSTTHMEPRNVELLVRAYGRWCLAVQTTPRVDELAHQANVRPEQLSRAYYAATGRHLTAGLKRLPLEHAAALLKETDLALREIMQAAGYLSIATFYRRFKREFGIPPAMYRQCAALDDA